MSFINKTNPIPSLVRYDRKLEKKYALETKQINLFNQSFHIYLILYFDGILWLWHRGQDMLKQYLIFILETLKCKWML